MIKIKAYLATLLGSLLHLWDMAKIALRLVRKVVQDVFEARASRRHGKRRSTRRSKAHERRMVLLRRTGMVAAASAAGAAMAYVAYRVLRSSKPEERPLGGEQTPEEAEASTGEGARSAEETFPPEDAIPAARAAETTSAGKRGRGSRRLARLRGSH
ncbi:hypothetical protein [Saccharopolyspora sp. ASAGF58]|uniref:hypothetical protein n=1 Tax=Saccharopolyspora sp. ASAGF58 TaxID=2719023 RepID=UPI00143FF490|nr:hypothetical protein [Saccharopolyspora sp. ASAGF58]QIZ38076.1 hypothetical protein FDZ84_30305 [Saccharopolyspora sp. ASAGF58]